MKIPKEIKRLCPYCKKHTTHKVSASKKRAPSSLAHASKYRAKLRGKGRGCGNRGKYGSKPAITKWKMTGKKSSKKTDFRYECKECKKTHMQSSGIRAKKVEFT